MFGVIIFKIVSVFLTLNTYRNFLKTTFFIQGRAYYETEMFTKNVHYTLSTKVFMLKIKTYIRIENQGGRQFTLDVILLYV